MKMNSKKYIKLFMDKQLPEELSSSDCGKFYRLIMYMVGDNQFLGRRGSKGFRPLTVLHIATILCITERQAKNFLKKMEEYRIFKRVLVGDEEWYAVNPLYALKNKYISFTTFTIFADELKGEIPDSVFYKFMNDFK